MMRHHSRLIWMGLAVLVLGLGATAAQAEPPCDSVCHYGVACGTRCTIDDRPGGGHTTCEAAGYQCGCDDWVVIDAQQIGLLVNDCGIFFCKVSVLEITTEAPACGGETRNRCREYKVADCPHGLCPEEQGLQWCPL
jgi:hypothetical protein